AGFEHSIANMYFIPLGILMLEYQVPSGVINTANLNWLGFFHNLIPVTIGNIIGGSGLVALVYYIIYRRGAGQS
ncbi:MAG: formate/nitrite transporter family protein, partial [Nitrospirota bacterium]